MISLTTINRWFKKNLLFPRRHKKRMCLGTFQIVDKALLLQGFAIVGTAFLI